ncbi:hypothetical protein LIT32_17160 [Bacillus sp. CMF21]|uniref:hypothetical protein n=1 Tax=Metabacillus dongyingensis TaxID=2874282 RepID=UPI001CBD7014|nr:hypothetical protein [Metabacillus dongyingensis]UAL50930.1 hypothetical protein K8L98_17065 [Metabacillus dongyingensis]USK27206.1 hypothetical protein LIT32_17160 [Bacillus sp. CMF21]
MQQSRNTRITYMLKKTEHIPIKLKKEADPDHGKIRPVSFFSFKESEGWMLFLRQGGVLKPVI